MQMPDAADNSIDQELEDTLPASDPPSHATPSAHARSDAGRAVSDTAWIDLYRIEDANDGQHARSLGSITDLAETGELCFGTSPALGLLHHLVDAPGASPRVCLISGRVKLAQMLTLAVAPASSAPRTSVEAASPADADAPGQRPGRLVPSALSPADREVFWNAGHPDAGALRIVSRTVFDLDPRLLALVANGQAQSA